MGTAVALGSFDGVHKAHEHLVRNMTDYAKDAGLESVVYVFEPHPRALLFPEHMPGLLMTTAMKVRRLLEIGADRVHLERRGMAVLSLSPEDFVKNVLRDELGARHVTAGFNYRFGKNAAGDAALLQELCRKYGMTCRIIDGILQGGEPVSSTRLRGLLETGDIRGVNDLSFAPYTLEGEIKEGKKLGREIGFPTMNIEIPKGLLVPKKGVYASRTRIEGKVYQSVTNIGQNPTVEEAVPRAESHLFGFSGEAYGKCAEITLLEFLRPEQRFADVEALCAQIRQDTEKTRLFFERMDLHAADTD